MPLRYGEDRFPVMGTTAHVGLVGGSETGLRAVRSRLCQLERRWSRFLPQSELSRLNANAGVPVVVSAETYDLVAAATDAWKQTNGAFDPTIGSVMVGAGYDRSFTDGLPTEPRGLGGQPAAPGADGIILHPYGSAVHLPVGTQLDLGGMAKGWAADLVVAEMLGKRSMSPVSGAMVNIGGDVRISGTPPGREPETQAATETESGAGTEAESGTGAWTVGLDCPGAAETRTVTISDGAVCTSTKIKRRWTSAAGPEHHLRDPRTGDAIENGIVSVTIIAARAAQAEVLTKAAFAAGPAAANALVAATGATGLMVLDDGTTVDFDGLEPFLTTVDRTDGDLAGV